MNCLEVRSIEPGSALLGFEEILMFHNLLETINVCNICCSWEEGSHTDFSHVVRCLWMHCLKVRSIEPGSAIDCPPCDPDDPRQRFGRRMHNAILTSKKLGGEQRRNQEFRFRFRQCRYRNFWQEKAREFVILWIDLREYFHFLNKNRQEKYLP